MIEILLEQQIDQVVNTGLQVEGTVDQTFEMGVVRQKLLLFSGEIARRYMEGLQRARFEMAALRNFMLE